MNFVWKQVLVALAVLAALVVGGCGGDDESDGGDEPEAEALSVEEYEQRLPEVLSPLVGDLQEIGATITAGGSNEAAIEGASNASETIQTGIDGLDAIEPPEEATEAHEGLVTSLEAFRDAADEFAAIDPADEPAVEEGAATFMEAGLTFQEEFQAAADQLQEAGIEPQAPPGG